ncbi:trypsin-like peptidase domain-containing protein, partial [Arthrospira platensis SPKY1]|nr:trypsin-like peptidase domain-containing protein [Arthrospira platensis SPKY1]
PKSGTGSGVIYTDDGYILTNNHVIEFADHIEVTLQDNRKFKASVVGTYPKTDIAVLKIDAKDLPTLEIADSDEAEIGEWVLAVGNPLNLTSTVTAGIISAKGRDINIIP